MKKLLSLVFVAAVILSALTVFSLNASAASKGTLTVTCGGEVIGQVEVGNEFIYKVALNTCGLNIQAGQCELRYNDAYAKIVEYGETRSDGKIIMDAYCFPARIRNTNLVSNYLGEKNQANYNFTKYTGIGAFEDDDPYFKIRFQAVASGTVEIRHFVKCLYAITDGKTVRLIYNDVGNKTLNPTPYTACSVEPASAFMGDANGDYNLTVMDATFIQRLTAGVSAVCKEVNADVNVDGDVNLRDALCIQRYLAGMSTDTQTGEWIFDSEIA